jgi:hypothetical protein
MTAKTKEPSKGGRPSSFKDEFIEQALMLSKLGATDKELASFFDVSEVTLNAWKKSHTEFLKSLKDGKLLADARVSNALYTRAIGYELNDKHYPPDTTACIFWLKNRQPEKWREKQEQDQPTDLLDKVSELINKLPS